MEPNTSKVSVTTYVGYGRILNTHYCIDTRESFSERNLKIGWDVTELWQWVWCAVFVALVPIQMTLLVITHATVHRRSKFFHWQIPKELTMYQWQRRPPHIHHVATLPGENWNQNIKCMQRITSSLLFWMLIKPRPAEKLSTQNICLKFHKVV